jgi:hypothetical protein
VPEDEEPTEPAAPPEAVLEALPEAVLEAPPAALLDAEIRRLGDRLRSMSLERLAGPSASGGSRAEAAHRLGQELAEAAGRLAGLSSEAGPPTDLEVPYLGEMYAGDQVVVLGREVLRSAEAALESGADRALVDEELADAGSRCRLLRLEL